MIGETLHFAARLPYPVQSMRVPALVDYVRRRENILWNLACLLGKYCFQYCYFFCALSRIENLRKKR